MTRQRAIRKSGCERETVNMSDFKIGIISDWLKLPFAEAMRTCRELGADGVQI